MTGRTYPSRGRGFGAGDYRRRGHPTHQGVSGNGQNSENSYRGSDSRRGRGGSYGGSTEQVTHPYGFSHLAGLVKLPCDEVIMSVDKSSKALVATLTQSHIRDDMMHLLIQLIGQKLCADAPFPDTQNRLIAMAADSKFLEKVKIFTSLMSQSNMSSSPRESIEIDRCPVKNFEAQLAFYAFIAVKMPNLAVDSILPNVTAVKDTLLLLKIKKMIPATETLTQLEDRFEKLQSNLEDFKKEREDQEKGKTGSSDSKKWRYHKKEMTQGDIERLYLMTPPDEKFTAIQIVPTTQEILSEEEPFLRPNLINGKYPSAMTYLDVQFRLLREDFVAPLRESVREYMSNEPAYSNRKRKLPPGTIRFYHHVKLSKVEVMTETTIYMLQFELTNNLKRIKWDKSKRLLNGSLLLLTADRFTTIYFATVARRDEKQLARDGTIGVIWEGDKPPDLYGEMGFLMVECEVYFEAYRHTLKALQLMGTPAAPLNIYPDEPLFQRYPMVKYIVDMKTTDIPPPPKYLKIGQPELDFSMILTCNQDEIKRMIEENNKIDENESSDDEQKDKDLVQIVGVEPITVADLKADLQKQKTEVDLKPHFARVDDLESWPKAEEIGLDQAQYLAFQSAMTQELSLIQGPPGTGKTYLGLLIMKLLLSNRKIIWEEKTETVVTDEDLLSFRRRIGLSPYPSISIVTTRVESPILVVCYTNHALDQFLEGIISIMKSVDMEPNGNLIRVGGRSKVPALDEFSIQKQRDYYQKCRLYDPSFASSRFRARAELRDLQNVRSDLRDCFKGLGKPQGVVNLSHLDPDPDILRLELHKKLRNSLPINLQNILTSPKQLPAWLGLTQNFFKYPNFNSKIQLQNWFRLTVPQRQKIVEKVAPSTDSNSMEVEEGEYEFDMSELMLNRLDEQIVYQVDRTNQRKQFQSSYALATYWGGTIRNKREQLENQLKLPGNLGDVRKQWEIQEELETLKAEEIYQRNQTVFVQDILNAFRDGRLELPEVTPSLLARGHQEQPPLRPSYSEKWAIYFYAVLEAKKMVGKSINDTESLILKAQEKLAELNNHGDGIILKKAKVVGLTTTGAAKYSQLLRMMKSRIVIIEEAAEVMEASVVTSITEHCQHLILIGDHQQLRPTTTVYKLAKDYNLEISLFERLINNKLSWKYLKAQHRMRSEICKLLVPTIYKELDNHPEVLKYPDVNGLTKNLFFISHTQFEKADEDSMTKSNEYEALYIAKLCRHLLLQGYQSSQITILTTYIGQMFLIKKIINREDTICQGVRVTVVDNFQGEENDIILLSLVRSNEENRIGFLKIDNRINVALSRAKQGMYIIGNMSCMINSTDTWKKIKDELEAQKSIGPQLKVKCQIHGDLIEIGSPEEFQQKSPEGGCTAMCPGILPHCNHSCRFVCHVKDRSHEEYKCMEPCPKKCPAPETHPCPRVCCIMPCPPCMVFMDRNLSCGHSTNLPCHVDIVTYPCQEIVVKDLRCGPTDDGRHQASMACSFPLEEWVCQIKVDKTLTCGHVKSLPCHMPIAEYTCHEDTEKKLGCGHMAPMKCSQDPETVTCMTQTQRDLLCGHQQMARCSLPLDKIFCQTLVKQTMPDCKHEVNIECRLLDQPEHWECKSQCDTRLSCGHKCRRLHCHFKDDPDHVYYQCKEPCVKECDVGHKCKRKHLCHQKCNPCNVKLDKTIPECGHIINVQCHVDPSTQKCSKPCQRLVDCPYKHQCQKKCYEPCDPCLTLLEKWSVDCGHQIKVKCSGVAQRSMCTQLVSPSNRPFCGHAIEVPCNVQLTVKDEELLKYCHQPCGFKFSENGQREAGCFHTCPGDCSSCFQGRIHLKCAQKCERTLTCGHICKFPCSELCPPCNKPCTLTCGHSSCKKHCGFPCTDCKEPCTWACSHKNCGKLCDEECDRTGCDEPCPLKLDCSHDCIGLCGEPCSDLCRICHKEQVEELFFGTEDGENARFVLLKDCHHIIEVTGMDYWMKTEQTKGEIGIKRCPKCSKAITKSIRYRHILKKKMKDVIEVRNRIFGNIEKLKQSQQKVINILLNEEHHKCVFDHVRTALQNICYTLRQKRIKNGWRDTNVPTKIDQYQFESVDNILAWWREAEANVQLKVAPKPKKGAQPQPVGPVKQDLTGDSRQNLIEKYNSLFKILLARRRPLSGREIFDFDREFARLNDLTRLYRRQGIEDFENYHGAPLTFNMAKNHITQPTPYNQEMKAQFTDHLKRLDTLLKADWTRIEKKRKDRGNIFKAMGMAANHWYRCANGHLYTVGDCGGLNQSSQCPDCRLPIGGGSNNEFFRIGTESQVQDLTGQVVVVTPPDFTFGETVLQMRRSNSVTVFLNNLSAL